MNRFASSASSILVYPSKAYYSCIHRNKFSSKRIITTMAKTLKEAFQQGKLYTDTERYTFLKLPVASITMASNLISKCHSPTAFRGLLYDKDEITMMIPTSDYIAQKALLHQQHHGETEMGNYSYRLITFDVVLDPNLIGFMHAVTKVLAAEDISVLPFAAYSRDHIFVQEQDFEKAMGALERLKEQE